MISTVGETLRSTSVLLQPKHRYLISAVATTHWPFLIRHFRCTGATIAVEYNMFCRYLIRAARSNRSYRKSIGVFLKLQSLFQVRKDSELVSKGDIQLMDVTDPHQLNSYAQDWDRIVNMRRRKSRKALQRCPLNVRYQIPLHLYILINSRSGRWHFAIGFSRLT